MRYLGDRPTCERRDCRSRDWLTPDTKVPNEGGYSLIADRFMRVAGGWRGRKLVDKCRHDNSLGAWALDRQPSGKFHLFEQCRFDAVGGKFGVVHGHNLLVDLPARNWLQGVSAQCDDRDLFGNVGFIPVCVGCKNPCH